MMTRNLVGAEAMKLSTERRWRWSFYFFCLVYVVAFYASHWNAMSFDYCGGEATGPCLRDWLFMLSGWGTVVGGGLAAYFVYQTIVKMNEQLKEARRQTSFIVGDEDPELELRANDLLDGGNFEIVNWNRRPFFVVAANWQCSRPVGTMGSLEVEHPEKREIELGERGTLTRRLFIPGWKDRNAPPPEIRGRYYLVLMDDADLTDREIALTPATLEIIGYLSGNIRTAVKLTATRPLSQVVAIDQHSLQ